MSTSDKRLTTTELDFDNIKNNLKNFMRSQSEFTDYNFEGSGLNALLDVLAYNTHYLAMNANMAANEMFLDTASLRESVVSHAKTIGYHPRSARCPIVIVDLTITGYGSNTTITIPRGTIFQTTLNDLTYNFTTISDISATIQQGSMVAKNVSLYEGTYITTSYVADSTNVDQKFLLNDNRSDTTTLSVSVLTSSTDSTSVTYSLADDITQVSRNSLVYFIQESVDGKNEIYFGDGIVGKKLSDGNIVKLSYVVTNKEEANGASSFSAISVSTTDGVSVTVTPTLLSSASGGSEPESIQSIKLNAPLDYASQGRAVTTADYQTIVPKLYPNTKAIKVWGGEDNDVKTYGKVFISIVPIVGSVTSAAKTQLINDLKNTYAIASIRPVIVDPVTTLIKLSTTFRYNPKKTVKSSESLRSNVVATIVNYNDDVLKTFNTIHRHSFFSGLVDDTDESILSSITNVQLSQSFKVTLNESTKYTLNFNNTLHNPHPGHNSTAGGILSSTGFKISGNDNELFLDEDGRGNIRLYYLVGSVRNYLDSTAGTIDYSSGQVVITSLNITSISNVDGVASTSVRVAVTPESKDIVAVRDQVLEIDLENSSVSSIVDTIETGSTSAGTDVVTSSSFSGSTGATTADTTSVSTGTTSTTTSTSSSSSSSDSGGSGSSGYGY